MIRFSWQSRRRGAMTSMRPHFFAYSANFFLKKNWREFCPGGRPLWKKRPMDSTYGSGRTRPASVLASVVPFTRAHFRGEYPMDVPKVRRHREPRLPYILSPRSYRNPRGGWGRILSGGRAFYNFLHPPAVRPKGSRRHREPPPPYHRVGRG